MICPRGAKLEGSRFVQAGAFCRNGSDPHTPSFFLEGNSTNSPKLTRNYMSPLRQILASLQADLSLTTAIFYEPDSLSSLRSCPSFPVVLSSQGDRGKASKSLSKRPSTARNTTALQITNSSQLSQSSAWNRAGLQPLNELMNALPLTHKLMRVPGFPGPRKRDRAGDTPSHCQPPATQGCAWMGAGTQHHAPSTPRRASHYNPGNQKTPTRSCGRVRGCLPPFPFNRSRESPSSKAAKSFPMARWLSCFKKKKNKK